MSKKVVELPEIPGAGEELDFLLLTDKELK